ncbi:MAG: LacI family transcriptional regulator [Clostridiales bacterium]|nr:LacI family transcriptional regulator [Clostridiales bacterium]
MRKTSRVTLRDIAAELNCTVNTVSRALNDKGDISPSMKDRVRQAATRMGYIHNGIAASLRSGKTGVVAVVVDAVSNLHFSIVVHQIEARMREIGKSTMILCTDCDMAIERDALTAAISLRVDGIILCPAFGGEENQRLALTSGIPTVLIGRRGLPDLDAAICDDEQGGYLAARHLIALGHKKLMYLGASMPVSSEVERRAGFMRAVAEAGPEFALATHSVSDMLGLHPAEARALWPDGAATGAFVFNDIYAYALINALAGKELRVPGDLSVVAFDNISEHYDFMAPLTTIGVSAQPMYDAAVDMLIARMDGEERPPTCAVMPVRVCNPDATCRAPGARGA